MYSVGHKVLSVLETRDGVNLASEEFIRPEWRQHIETSSDGELLASTKEAFYIQAVILLYMFLVDLLLRECSGIFK